MTQDLIYFLGPMDVTQHDGNDTDMDDASFSSDEFQFEDVFEDAAEIFVPPPTPVDAGDLDAILENFEVDPDADEQYDLPPDFPERLGRLIRHIPNDDPSCKKYRNFAVDFLLFLYGSGSPENIQLLQQLAALLAQAPPRVMCDMESLVTELVMSCMRTEADLDFLLSEFMEDLIPKWGRRIMTWLAQTKHQVFKDIFGIPVTGLI